jgi:hypothetical protein
MSNEGDRGTQTAKKPDTSEYSASKAPETRREAEERTTTPDSRLIPGGDHGATVEIGMSAMDRSEVPNEARPAGSTPHRDRPDDNPT